MAMDVLPYLSGNSSGNHLCSDEHLANQWLRVVAVLRGDSNVKGTVTFEQESESSPTTITYDISGNDPNAERGMHVHAFGDNTNGCTSAGPHCKLLRTTTMNTSQESISSDPISLVNPHNKEHGAPEDSERHVGDLGNFKTDGQGNGKGTITDKFIKLIGSESVIGVRKLHQTDLSFD